MLDWITPGTASGVGVALLTGLSVGAIAYGGAGLRRSTGVLAAAIIAGLVFQVVHFIEHGFQAGYWFRNLDAPPWITPWAETAAGGLAWSCSWAVTDRPSVGVELLHLTGNTIFLAAIIAMAFLTMSLGRRVRGSPSLQAALAVQGFHVFEHVLLTASVVLDGRALGFSTGFGEMSGTALFTYRIWFHFAMNLAATGFALLAFREMVRRGDFDGMLPSLPSERPATA
jgi:hypothetical protein